MECLLCHNKNGIYDEIGKNVTKQDLMEYKANGEQFIFSKFETTIQKKIVNKRPIEISVLLLFFLNKKYHNSFVSYGN